VVSSGPSALPVILNVAAEMTAAQSKDCVGSPNGPEHSRPFETGTDHALAASFDDAGTDKQMLAEKLGISHALRIPLQVVRLGAYLLATSGLSESIDAYSAEVGRRFR
jgi:hypothetical protein